jgi:hypothetical protein
MNEYMNDFKGMGLLLPVKREVGGFSFNFDFM